MRAICLLLLLALLPTDICAQKYVAALWRQELLWTRSVGDSPGSYRISSSISTGTVGINAEVRYNLEVKVNSWNKPFKAVRESVTERQTLTITLRETSNPQELAATFEHIVYDGQKIKLRFSGVTRLVRSD